jgi:LAO/AO transport system kinase
MRAVAPYPISAHVIGVTGAPGVGKSTSTSMLVMCYRAEGKRVGVLAVDPSSPFSGGALLGDRVRMQDHALDGQVFIRSMATRGHLGGLAWSTPQAIRVLDAAGFDIVIVETVGVGQSEVDIAASADTTLVLLAPGMGDGIQAAKAGILEIGDVYVVNKSDREGAHQVVKELRNSLALVPYVEGSWKPRIVSTVAWKNEGGDEVVAAIAKHRAWGEESGALARARRARVESEITEIALTALRRQFAHVPGDRRLSELADRVLAGTLDPYTAADELLAGATSLR